MGRSLPILIFMFCSFLAVSFSLSTDLHADTPKTPVNIVTIPLPPWGYIEPGKGETGICYEWTNAIAERMNRPAENRILPMARVFKEIEFSKADLSVFLRTPYSEKIAVPVANVGIPFRTVVWPRKGIKVNSYEDLKGVRMSMARGLKVGGEFSKQTDLTIIPSQDYAHSMQLFSAGRVDAIIGTHQSLLYNAYKSGLLPSKEFSAPFEVARLEGWVQVSKEFVEREGLEDVKKATESLIQDGTFAQIYKKYINLMSQQN